MAVQIPEGTTREEILAEVKRAATEGGTPFERQNWQPDGGEPADEEAFTSHDLAADYTLYREPYTIPRANKRVWVAGLSDEDLEWILSRTIKRMKDRPAVDDATVRRAMRPYQVIRCCWRGPALRADGKPTNAKRCFGESDYVAIRDRLPFGIVGEICGISDRLSGSEEALGAGALAFFRHIHNACATWPSQSGISDASLTGWQDTLTRLQSLVSRALVRGSVDTGMLEELESLQWQGQPTS